MGKLQNENFKTEAELVLNNGTKAQLLNDTKIYVTASGINKTLDDAIIDGDIGGGGFPTLVLSHAETSGTAGGSCVASTWNTRNINQSSGDTSFLVSLSSSQFELDPGDYLIHGFSMGYNANVQKVRLHNVTDNVTYVIGGSSYTTGDQQSPCPMYGRTGVIPAGKLFEIQHWTGFSQATNGLGLNTSNGIQENYAQFFITKVG